MALFDAHVLDWEECCNAFCLSTQVRIVRLMGIRVQIALGGIHKTVWRIVYFLSSCIPAWLQLLDPYQMHRVGGW